MKPAVVIVGGTGVFGGRLARRLIEQDSVRVVIAGRDLNRLIAFCNAHGGEPLQLDRDGDVSAVFQTIKPFAVVDAAGPFQNYGADPYRLARAAIAAGSHYLDLSDDAAFTAGIVALNEAALAAGVIVLSGVSSVPAISAAAVRVLSAGLGRIDLIDTVILPGNRAPRGMSVVRAIVSQVGRPLSLFRGGLYTRVPAWSGLRRVAITADGAPALDARWASFIGAPDLQLFPERFEAKSVLFRAGLELAVMHLGLWALSWLVRVGAMKQLTPLAGTLHQAATWLERFGSDRGGMRVAVTGIDGSGRRVCRAWTLIAEAGEGPEIPAIPAFVMIGRLLAGNAVHGSRPCLDEPDLDEVEAALSRPAMWTARTEVAAPVLYERVLGPAFQRLPPALRVLHAVVDRKVFVGESSVEVGSHPLAGLIRRLMRFPPSSQRVPVEVTMIRDGERERWTRCFGDACFVSVLNDRKAARPGDCHERFGLLDFELRLIADESGIAMPVHRASFLGLVLPKAMTPESRTREFVDEQERVCFDVEVLLPKIGRVIRYSGWLSPRLS